MQGFEKMISGIYLGEIARLVLHRMSLESDVFGDAADSLSTPFMLRYLEACYFFAYIKLWRYARREEIPCCSFLLKTYAYCLNRFLGVLAAPCIYLLEL
jgi:hypothetical protein